MKFQSLMRKDTTQYGQQFLDCLKLLYSESIRLELPALAGVLEVAFEEGILALEQDDAGVPDSYQSIVEFRFLKEFGKLDREQQLLLIQCLQRSETGKTKI